jgi:hypothetical protein
MGYYTRFIVNVYTEKTNGKFEKLDYTSDEAYLIERRLEDISEYSIDLGELGDDMKWYDHESNIKELSKLFPNHFFFVEGEGEEHGDMWKTITKAGEIKGSWNISISEPSFTDVLKLGA